MLNVEIELGPSASLDQLIEVFLGQVRCLPEQVRRRIKVGKDLRKLAIACVAVAFVDGNGEGVRRPVL